MLYSAKELAHYGISGQKWGVRRFQNPDGTLTPEGKSRYQIGKAFEQERENIQKQEKAKLLKDPKTMQEADALAYKRSYDQIAKKYGPTALDDIKYYKNASTAKKWILGIVGGGLTVFAITALIGGKNFKNHIQKNEAEYDRQARQMEENYAKSISSMREDYNQAVKKMDDRHKQAASYIKEAVQRIHDNPHDKDAFDRKIKKIDDLLKNM